MKNHFQSRSGVARVSWNTSEVLAGIFRIASLAVILNFCLILFSGYSVGQTLKLNNLEYFETPGVNVLVYSNQYTGMFYDEKTAGIEIIHHGVRTSTGGAVRLQNTPEQWDLIPTVVSRKVDTLKNSIDVVLKYAEYDFTSRINVTAKDKGVIISVYLDHPLPEALKGRAGLNLEFLPASYFEKTFLADGVPGLFPLYPSSSTTIEPVSNKIRQFAGHTTFDDRGRGEFIVPQPIATGKTIILAPEDPERLVKIQSADAELMLFDGRNLAQNDGTLFAHFCPQTEQGRLWNGTLNQMQSPAGREIRL